MVKMIRPGGLTAQFNTVEDGESAGYFLTHNEMAIACRKAFEAVEPESKPVNTERPKPVLDIALGDRPKPVEGQLSRSDILVYAEAHDLDTSVHHNTLRKQVEDLLDAESGSDISGVQ